jgi:predicted AlkP superfamily phosphohydrolase/phosphomutase
MRTLILGLDAFDPRFFEGLLAQGKVPNLAKLVQLNGYSHLAVSNPPQGEVSWTSIATGLNPGGHGVFDFVHRDPSTYTPYVSLLPTQKSLAGVQFIPPFNAPSLFEHAVRKGFPAKSLWWPATFPARPEIPVSTIPGLGTPDIHGKLGVGTLYAPDQSLLNKNAKTGLERLQGFGKGKFKGSLKGPDRKKGDATEAAEIEFQIELIDKNTARLFVGKLVIELSEGKWSPIFEIAFKVGLLFKVHAITRVVLTQTQPCPILYFLPLQIHPLHSLWRYGTPQDFVRKSWQAGGPFQSLGWPQDTTGLEDGCINDTQFLDLCETIFRARETTLFSHLQDFQEGVIACVFDSLDRIQHMFWRDRPDIIEAWYVKLDSLVGRTLEFVDSRKEDKFHLLVISDHGFTAFDQKVHLNRWLADHAYLTPKAAGESKGLNNIDWSHSRAYALGLNSIYINLQGREGEGIVPIDQVEGLLEQLSAELISWMGPDHRPVINHCYPRGEALSGSLTSYGPDLLVGYSPGYRASQQTGLGGWEVDSLETNRDHWGADHCIDPRFVPGVLFSNEGLENLPQASYKDIPTLALGEKVKSGDSAPPSYPSQEDREVLEERLKSLGYL